jgi:HEPN domain-containing protein
MDRKVEIWVNQARKDFESAKKNFKIKEYYIVAFLVQQSVEKMLKAYYVYKKKNYADKTHSLVYLGQTLKLPEKLLRNVRKINPDFIFTRYPDLNGIEPYKAYDEQIAKERLEKGEEVLKWIEKQIK